MIFKELSLKIKFTAILLVFSLLPLLSSFVIMEFKSGKVLEQEIEHQQLILAGSASRKMDEWLADKSDIMVALIKSYPDVFQGGDVTRILSQLQIMMRLDADILLMNYISLDGLSYHTSGVIYDLNQDPEGFELVSKPEVDDEFIDLPDGERIIILKVPIQAADNSLRGNLAVSHFADSPNTPELEKLIQLADEALYHVKNNGRNNYLLYSDE